MYVVTDCIAKEMSLRIRVLLVNGIKGVEMLVVPVNFYYSKPNQIQRVRCVV
jgi:hypothetical protein